MIIFVVLHGEEGKTVAVLPVVTIEPTVADAQTAMACEDALQSGLAETPGTAPVERKRLAEVLRELSLSGNGLADDAQAPRVGGKLGADAVLFSSLRRNGNMLTLYCRAVACASGQVVSAGQADGDAEAIIAQVPRLAASIARTLASAATASHDAVEDIEQVARRERLAVLHSQGLHDEAVGLAVRCRNPRKVDAAALADCLDALALAGFSDLASAEADRRKVIWTKPAQAPAPMAPANNMITDEPFALRSRRAVALKLDSLAGNSEQVMLDRIAAWEALALKAKEQKRLPTAASASREAWRRRFAYFSLFPVLHANMDHCMESPDLAVLDPAAKFAMQLLAFRESEIFGARELPIGFSAACLALVRTHEAVPNIGPGWQQAELPASQVVGNPNVAPDCALYAIDLSALPLDAKVGDAIFVVGGEPSLSVSNFRILGPDNPNQIRGRSAVDALAELRRLGSKAQGIIVPLLTLTKDPVALRVFFRGKSVGTASPTVSALVEQLSTAIINGDPAEARRLAADPRLLKIVTSPEGKSLISELPKAKP